MNKIKVPYIKNAAGALYKCGVTFPFDLFSAPVVPSETVEP